MPPGAVTTGLRTGEFEGEWCNPVKPGGLFTDNRYYRGHTDDLR